MPTSRRDHSSVTRTKGPSGSVLAPDRIGRGYRDSSHEVLERDGMRSHVAVWAGKAPPAEAAQRGRPSRAAAGGRPRPALCAAPSSRGTWQPSLPVPPRQDRQRAGKEGRLGACRRRLRRARIAELQTAQQDRPFSPIKPSIRAGVHESGKTRPRGCSARSMSTQRPAPTISLATTGTSGPPHHSTTRSLRQWSYMSTQCAPACLIPARSRWRRSRSLSSPARTSEKGQPFSDCLSVSSTEVGVRGDADHSGSPNSSLTAESARPAFSRGNDRPVPS
jgi:hypothetical protein